MAIVGFTQKNNMKFFIIFYLFLIGSIAQAAAPIIPQWLLDDLMYNESELTKAYINKYKAIAIGEERKHNIPASITLAQGLLESNIGRSDLAKKANNHFGLKCHKNWSGGTYYKQDDDPQPSCFRAYQSGEDSYNDHSNLLINNARYNFLFKLSKTDYKAWAHGLKQAGYASDLQYAPKLINLIERLNLHKLQTNLSPDEDNTIVQVITYSSSPVTGTVYIRNKLKNVIAQSDESAESIATKFHINPRRIYIWNDISEGTKLQAGQIVYLQHKKLRYKGPNKFHIVKPGETMYSISQMYGIKLKRFYKKNRMNVNEYPVVGEQLALKCKIKNKPQTTTTAPTLNPTVITIEKPLISSPTPTPPLTPTTKRTHTVQVGENLYRIGLKYNVSADSIKAKNKLTSNEVKVGSVLIID